MVESEVNIEIQKKINAFKKNGKIKEAINTCQEFLKDNPTNSDIHVLLGDLYIEQHLDIYEPKQYIDEAITEYQCALESNLKSSTLYYKLGVAFYYKGEFEKSINYLTLSIEQEEKTNDSYYMLARIFYKKDRIQDTINYITKGLSKEKIKKAKYYYLYFLAARKKQHITPKDFFAPLRLFLLFLLFLPLDKKSRKDISLKFERLKYFFTIVNGYYLEKNRNINKAIEIYSQAIEKAPKLINLYISLGDAYKSIGRISDAINEYRMAIWLDPLNVEAYKSLCCTYEDQGDYENAIKIYFKLIEMYPNNAIYYSNLANIFYLKGDLKSAISCYQTAITLNPNKKWTSVIAQTLGYVLQESKENYDAAISAYQSASLLNPNDIDIYVSLGSAFYDKGDYNNALSSYRVALEIEPDNARIHCNLGYLLWGKGVLDEAIKEYEISVKLDPTYDIAYNNLGVIYLDDLGRVQKAIHYFQCAIDNNSNYALAYYNLARATSVKGDKIEAARLFQIALDLNSYTNELDSNEIKSRIDNLFH